MMNQDEIERLAIIGQISERITAIAVTLADGDMDVGTLRLLLYQLEAVLSTLHPEMEGWLC